MSSVTAMRASIGSGEEGTSGEGGGRGRGGHLGTREAAEEPRARRDEPCAPTVHVRERGGERGCDRRDHRGHEGDDEHLRDDRRRRATLAGHRVTTGMLTPNWSQRDRGGREPAGKSRRASSCGEPRARPAYRPAEDVPRRTRGVTTKIGDHSRERELEAGVEQVDTGFQPSRTTAASASTRHWSAPGRRATRSRRRSRRRPLGSPTAQG